MFTYRVMLRDGATRFIYNCDYFENQGTGISFYRVSTNPDSVVKVFTIAFFNAGILREIVEVPNLEKKAVNPTQYWAQANLSIGAPSVITGGSVSGS